MDDWPKCELCGEENLPEQAHKCAGCGKLVGEECEIWKWIQHSDWEASCKNCGHLIYKFTAAANFISNR